MARQSTESLRGGGIGESQINPVGTQVVARPVSTVVDPAESNYTRLANALQNFLPGMNQYAQQEAAEKRVVQQKADQEAQENSTLQGMKQRQMDGEAPVFSQEADPYWTKGYMKMHGWMQAAQSSSEFAALYEENKLNPEFNVQQALDEHMSKNLQGLTDPEAIEGFMERTSSLRSHYLNDQAKIHTTLLRQQDQEQLQAYVNDAVAPLSKENPETARQWIDGFMHNQRFRGYTRKELGAMLTEATVNHAVQTLNPSVLAMLEQKDASGVSIADNPDLADKILAAKRSIATATQQELKAVAEEDNKALAGLYANHKANKTLTPEFILENSTGPLAYFGTSSEVESAWTAFFKQEEEAQQTQNWQRIYDEGTLAFFSNDPEAKKWVGQRRQPVYEKTLAAFSSGDEQAFQAGVREIVQDIERTKIADDRLTGIMQAATQAMPMQKGDKEVVPPDFNVGYAIYSTLKESGNSTLLSKMAGEDAMMIFAGYESELKYHRDSVNALKAAKAQMSPEARENMKAITLQERTSVKEDGAAAFRGLIDTGSMFAAENVDQMATAVMQEYTKARGQGLSHDAATEFAKTRVRSSHIKAGGVWVPVSATESEPEALSGGLAKAMSEFVGDGKTVKLPLVTFLNDDKHTYKIIDFMSGKVVSHTAEDLKTQFKQTRELTPEQMMDAQKFKQEIKGGAVTPEMAYNSWGTVQSQFAAGHLSAREYTALSQMREKHRQKLMEDRMAETLRVRRASQVAPVGKTPEPVEDIHRPLPSPPAKAGSVYEHVSAAVKSGDHSTALTMMSEGLVLRAYPDPSTGTNIGAGYSLTAHGPEKARKDLLAAGVSPSMVDAVITGKAEITPKQGMELLRNSLREYEGQAKAAVGEAWKDLPTNVRAVITDMAYVTGNPGQFKTAIGLAREGKWDEMISSLSLKYRDRNTGEFKEDKRRVGLWKSMLRSPQEFAANVNIAGRS